MASADSCGTGRGGSPCRVPAHEMLKQRPQADECSSATRMPVTCRCAHYVHDNLRPWPSHTYMWHAHIVPRLARARPDVLSVVVCNADGVLQAEVHTKRWSLLRSMLSIIAEYPDSHEHVGSHTCVHTPFGQLVILRTKRGLHGHHELWRVGVHVVDGPKS